MDKSEWRTVRISIWWGCLGASLIALIQASGSLTRFGVIGLVVCGSSAFSLAVWEHGWHRTPKSGWRVPKLLLLLCLSWAPLSVLGWLVWPKSSLPATTEVDETLNELNEINDFIGKKDEEDLRTTFDFPDMLRYNIALQKQSLKPDSVSTEEAAEINAFFLNGNAVAGADYLKMKNYRGEIDYPHNKVWFVNTSEKYQKSLKVLDSFISSAAVPPEVSRDLQEFDRIVRGNTAWMMNSLNQSLNASPKSIIENDIPSSKWFTTATNRYWSKFVPLRPTPM